LIWALLKPVGLVLVC